MSVHSIATRPRGVLAALGDAVVRFGGALAANSDGMRCAREAERLFKLSDAELAKLGLTRDRVVLRALHRPVTGADRGRRARSPRGAGRPFPPPPRPA